MERLAGFMVLDFAADQVSIDRPQGSDSLFFRFDDGSSIELQNFYTQYNKDAIPSFEVDGQLIAGADFFNAFGPDLAPAAGPSASPTRSGRYRDFANAGLEHGVNHLDGLDYRLSFAGDTQPNINPYASPFLTNAAPTLSTGGAAIAIGLTERAWRGTGDNAAPDSQRGSFSVADPDGDSLTTTVSMMAITQLILRLERSLTVMCSLQIIGLTLATRSARTLQTLIKMQR